MHLLSQSFGTRHRHAACGCLRFTIYSLYSSSSGSHFARVQLRMVQPDKKMQQHAEKAGIGLARLGLGERNSRQKKYDDMVISIVHEYMCQMSECPPFSNPPPRTS